MKKHSANVSHKIATRKSNLHQPRRTLIMANRGLMRNRLTLWIALLFVLLKHTDNVILQPRHWGGSPVIYALSVATLSIMLEMFERVLEAFQPCKKFISFDLYVGLSKPYIHAFFYYLSMLHNNYGPTYFLWWIFYHLRHYASGARASFKFVEGFLRPTFFVLLHFVGRFCLPFLKSLADASRLIFPIWTYIWESMMSGRCISYSTIPGDNRPFQSLSFNLGSFSKAPLMVLIPGSMMFRTSMDSLARRIFLTRWNSFRKGTSYPRDRPYIPHNL